MSKFLLKQHNTVFLLLLGNSADYSNLLRHFYFCKVLDWFDWTLLLLQGYDLTSLVVVKCSGVVALFCIDYQEQSCQSYPATLTLSAAAPGLAQGLAVPSMALSLLQGAGSGSSCRSTATAAVPMQPCLWLRVLKVFSGSPPKKGTNARRKNENVFPLTPIFIKSKSSKKAPPWKALIVFNINDSGLNSC